MVEMAGEQAPMEVVRAPEPSLHHSIEGKRSYADMLQPQVTKQVPLLLKPITYLHGEHRVVWEEEEVTQMIANEHLQYAIIGKFSYG